MPIEQAKPRDIRHIALVGGTQITPHNARFYYRLGWELASEDDLLIMTGGFKHFKDAVDVPSADWSAICGAIAYLESVNLSLEDRIETILPEPENDWSRVVRFNAGRNTVVRGATLEARRFSIVHKADLLVTVQGAKGTRQMIDLAFAINKLIFPLPFTGGISQERWGSNKNKICQWFFDDDRHVLEIESVSLERLTDEGISTTAKTVKTILLDGLQRKWGSQFHTCFISFSSADEEFVQKLHSDLLAHDVRCWFAPHDLPIGAKTRDNIVAAIYSHEKVLIVLSSTSIESQWVEQKKD